jgi:Sortase domain
VRVGAGLSLLASGAALSIATLIIGLAQPRAASPLSLRVLGPPPVPLVAADVPVSSSSPPVTVSIPAIAVSSTLEGLRLNGDGSLQTPRDPNLGGWYADGPAPGDQGAAVFVGHLDSKTGPAVFWRLASLLRGDQILVRRADGRTLTFVVDHSAVFPRTDLPTATVFGASGSELHLITCYGTWDAQIGRYDHSLVVFARLAEIDNVAVSQPTLTPRLTGVQ